MTKRKNSPFHRKWINSKRGALAHWPSNRMWKRPVKRKGKYAHEVHPITMCGLYIVSSQSEEAKTACPKCKRMKRAAIQDLLSQSELDGMRAAAKSYYANKPSDAPA